MSSLRFDTSKSFAASAKKTLPFRNVVRYGNRRKGKYNFFIADLLLLSTFDVSSLRFDVSKSFSASVKKTFRNVVQNSNRRKEEYIFSLLTFCFYRRLMCLHYVLTHQSLLLLPLKRHYHSETWWGMVIVKRWNIIFSLLTFCFYRRLMCLHYRFDTSKSFAASVKRHYHSET